VGDFLVALRARRMKGRQDLHTKRSPEKLRLAAAAMIQSAISPIGSKVSSSSGATEQVFWARQASRSGRAGGSWLSRSALLDSRRPQFNSRNRGYYPAASFPESRAVGRCRPIQNSRSDIVEHYPDGRSRVRSGRYLPPKRGPDGGIRAPLGNPRENSGHSVVALAAANLDFSAFTFPGWQWKSSLLLLLLMSWHVGFEVGRYNQPGTSDRREQRAVLRNAGTKFGWLARGETIPGPMWNSSSPPSSSVRRMGAPSERYSSPRGTKTRSSNRR